MQSQTLMKRCSRRRTNIWLRENSTLQNFVLLLDLFRPFIINTLLFCCFVLGMLLSPLLWPLMCLVLYTLLFLVLDPLLFCRLVVCLHLFFVLDPLMFCHFIESPFSFLVLNPLLSSCLVILLFLVLEFQLFCCRFLCLVYFFILDLHILEHSNNPCQMSLGLACQPALQSLFVRFRHPTHIIRTIGSTYTIRPIPMNVSGVSIVRLSTVACWPAIINKMRQT